MASPVFVGREAELRSLHAAYQSAIEGRPGIVVVAGDAGIGKSRLVAEFSASVRTAGGRVLSGGCVDVAENSLPYAPVIEAFRALVSDNGRGDRAGRIQPVDELARLLPELGSGPRATPFSTDGESAVSQTRLFEATLSVIDVLSRDRPLLLVFEDIHWADRSTRDLLMFLARNLSGQHVLVVATYRLDGVVRGHPLLAFLAELERNPAVSSLTLAPFGNDEVRAQMEAILGRPPAEKLVARVRERSDGNAFFVEEILASGENPGSTVTPTLREMLLARVNDLPQPSIDVVRAVAVAGRQATDEVIASVSQLDDRELVVALREAVLRGVVIAPDSHSIGEDAYRFRHALLREAVEEDLLPAERRRLHADVASALEHLGGDKSRQATVAGELAYHWTEAGRKPEALVASIQAAEAALVTHAPAEAARHFARASELFPAVEGADRLIHNDESELLERTGHAAFLAGELTDAVRFTRAALDALAPDVDPTRRGLLERQLGSELSALGNDGEALAAMQRAVDLVPPEPTFARARVLCMLGAGLMLAGRFDESRRLCQESLAVARAVRNQDLIAQSLNFLGVDLVNLGEVEAGLDRLRESVAAALEGGSDTTVVEAYNNLAFMLDVVDRPAEGIEVAIQGIAHADRLGLGRAAGAGLRATAAGLLYRAGRWTEAQDVVEEALKLDPQGADSFTLVMYRAKIATARGHFADADADIIAARLVAETNERADAVPYLHATAAELAVWEGRSDDARAAVAAGLRALVGTDHKAGAAPLLALGARTEAEHAERARDRRETGAIRDAIATAERMLVAARELEAALGPEGSRPSVRANLSTVEGEWERIRGYGRGDAWERARMAWDEAGDPYAAAYAGYREAQARLASAGDHSAAVASLVAADRTARQLGALPLMRAIGDLAQRARISLDEPKATRHDAASSEQTRRLGLTARERSVLAFVAQGMTNRQIADALFISPKTASVHVTNILAKLGVGSRFDARSMALRLGLDRMPTKESEPAVAPALAASAAAHYERAARTFMFTDIVNSTRLMEAIGDDAWVTLRQWHDRSLRALFDRSKGEELDHAGDGFFVAFNDPSSAVRCAISIQKILADHRRTQGFSPSVRIGIHSGEATRTGSTYSGLAVHATARIAALAGPGQIIASAATAQAAGTFAGAPQRVNLPGLVGGVDIVHIDWMRELSARSG